MTKKHIKSKEMENHKNPTHKNLLKEEFGQELGDMNSAQIYGVLEGNKKRGNKEDKNKKE